MIGSGKVGMELLRQTWENPNYRYTAVSDSSGIATNYSGFAYNDLVRLVSLKERGGKIIEYNNKLTQITDDMENALGSRPDIIVDVASHQTYGILMKAIGIGLHVIGSNKLPYADVKSGEFQELFSKAREKQKIIDNRTVVSANLGVLVRVREFLNTAGGVSHIRGGLSGTMGYVSWRINEDIPFSQAFYEAVSKGYTESDFRVDMRGLDSARKAVIIGRTNGYELELSDVKIEELIPPELEKVDVKEAFKMLPAMNERMKKRVESAKKNNCTLRYVGELDFDRGDFKIGFFEIPIDDPQSSARGSWNKVTMYPRYWKGEPLTIEGPGAGINVTTQGLLAGLYDLSNMNKSPRK